MTLSETPASMSTGPLPASRKVYLSGRRTGVTVPMREVALSTGDRVVLYDTSGPYTDPVAAVDVQQGLPELRAGWLRERGDTVSYSGRVPRPEDDGRKQGDLHNLDAVFAGPVRRPRRANGDRAVTQLAYARRRLVTPEMEFVAVR